MTEGPDSPDQADRDESMTEATASGLSGAMRGTQRAPRRVEIRHRGGTYSIHFGDRTIASFCQEFSEITGYGLPEDARQQVYITLESIGEVRPWHWHDGAADHPPMRVQQDQAAQEAPPSRPEAGILRRSMAHPEPSEDWRREVYERLHREIGQCSDMLALLERL